MTQPHDARVRVLADIPVTERRLELTGISTAVLEGGDGPPLVLLHGGIECGGAVWAPVLAGLADRYRVVVPDIPGLGESDPVDRLDADTFTNWFAGLLDQTGCEKPSLVAHSLGGSLAARFAVGRAHLLHRLVIVGTPAIGRYRMPLGLRVAAIRVGLRPTERNNERFERWAFQDLERTRRQDPEWFDAFNAYSLARAGTPHVKHTMRRLIRAETRPIPADELRRIDTPTTLLWGELDRMVPLSVAEAASSRFGWPLHVIDKVGHVPYIERPAAFLRVVSELLSESYQTEREQS
jgi:pimeloyl-ACP methyl ester carboxylesterase